MTSRIDQRKRLRRYLTVICCSAKEEDLSRCRVFHEAPIVLAYGFGTAPINDLVARGRLEIHHQRLDCIAGQHLMGANLNTEKPHFAGGSKQQPCKGVNISRGNHDVNHDGNRDHAGVSAAAAIVVVPV